MEPLSPTELAAMKAWMTAEGLSQRDVAQQVKVGSNNTVSLWLNGGGIRHAQRATLLKLITPYLKPDFNITTPIAVDSRLISAIDAWCQTNNSSVLQLALQSGVDQTTLSSWRCGKVKSLTFTTWAKISPFLTPYYDKSGSSDPIQMPKRQINVSHAHAADVLLRLKRLSDTLIPGCEDLYEEAAIMGTMLSLHTLYNNSKNELKEARKRILMLENEVSRLQLDK